MHAVRRTLYGADRELRVLIVGLGGGVLPLYLLDVRNHPLRSVWLAAGCVCRTEFSPPRTAHRIAAVDY